MHDFQELTEESALLKLGNIPRKNKFKGKCLMKKRVLKKREGKFQNGTSIVGLGSNPCRLGQGTMGISMEIFREKKKEKQDTNKLSVFFLTI